MVGVSRTSTLVRWVESCGGALVSVVFPADCRLCKRLLTRASRIPICGECLTAFQKVSDERCAGCGQPWLVAGEAQGREQICRECKAQKYAFDAARSYGIYEGALARAIVLMKYEKIEPLGTWFGKRLDEVVRAEGKRLEADIVVPVPLHRQREKERGYNQVDLFGRSLARRLGLAYRPVLLKRAKPRPEKHLLRQEERWEAVRGAFAMENGGRVDNSRILLLDDVMTTGATLDACTRVLREAGAKSVLAVTIARAARPARPAGEAI
jgi:competence protein ComFC